MKAIQLIQLSPEELTNKITEKVNIMFEDFKKNFQPKEPEELLTRQEVADIFKIDISSVHNWTKRGRLKSYGVPGSGRVYYKRSEIENILVELQ